jgi:segregation and condensation protein B
MAKRRQEAAERRHGAHPVADGDDGPTTPNLADPAADLEAPEADVAPPPADVEAAVGAVSDGDGEDNDRSAAADAIDGESSSGSADALAPAEPPPVAAAGRLASIIESLLFVSERPLQLGDFKRLTGERDAGKLTAAIEELRLRRQDAGVVIVEVAGGWHLRTHAENAPWVARILTGKPPRLSRAMLETLAIVAYRQPITRPEIDEIRGVDCGPVLKTLLERGLVRMIGKKEDVGRPILYGTTPEFLRAFSLRDLTELPTLREFHELGEAERAKVDAAAPLPTDSPAPVAAPRPPTPAVRELDPEEEDELMSDLERATAAATRAAAPAPGDAPPADTAPEAPSE